MRNALSSSERAFTTLKSVQSNTDWFLRLTVFASELYDSCSNGVK